MAEMLKFRKGTHAKLLEQTKVAGTIYVTTDEKAMYVDIDNDTRIRLGQTVNFATLSEFQTFLNTTIPPYSTEAFYYIEDKNALLRWKSSSGTTAVGGSDTKGEWVQINSTKDVEDKITALTNRVSTLEGTVGSATSGLVKDVNDLKTTVGSSTSGLVKAVADNADDIKDLQDAIGMNGATGSIGATVAQLVTDLDKAEGEIDTLKSTTAGHTSTLAEHAKSIADNAKAIEDQATADAATYATIANLNKEIQDRKDAIDKEVSDRDAAILVETNRATGAESTLSGRIALLETADYQNSAQVGNAIDAKIATARTEISNEIDGDVAALKADIVKDYATKSALNEVDGKVSKNTGDISTLSTNLSNHTTYAEETYAKKNDVYTKTEVYTKDQVNDAIDADVLVEANRAKGEEARLEGLISEAKGIANDALTKADFEEFKTSNTTDIDAAKKAGDDAQKTIDDYATAHAGDYTNTQIDAAIKVVGDAASKNAGDISTLSESFNTYKTTVDNTYAKKSDVYTKTETYTQSEVDDAIEAAVLAETNRAKKAEEANASSISTLQGTVNKLDGADTVEGSVKQQIKVAKEALQAEIDADIRAANAMEFIDGVANSSALPATAKNGDTYVAEGAFTLNGSQVLPGDLLIATGSEDVDTGLITNPTWRIVHTGYDATLEQTLKTVDGKIQLTSAVGNANNGAVTFEAKVGTSATVAVANNTVTIGIEWDNF